MPAAAPSLQIRRVSAADEPQLDELLGRLSLQDRYLRWFTGATDVHRAAHDAAVMRPGDVGLLATIEGEVVGHGLLARYGADRADVAFEVAPGWRHHGIASRLLAELIAVARESGVRTVSADVLCENGDMLAVFREHGGFRDERIGAERHFTCDLETS